MYMHRHTSLYLTVSFCHDEGSVTPSLLQKERSVRVHAYITQAVTEAALSDRDRKVGTDVQKEEKREGGR